MMLRTGPGDLLPVHLSRELMGKLMKSERMSLKSGLKVLGFELILLR